MEDLQAGQMADLEAAALAVGKDNVWFDAMYGFCKILSDLFGNVEFLFLEAKSSAQAAAVRIEVINLEARHELEYLKGRDPNAQRLQMAGREIGGLQRQFLEADIEIPGFLQIPQKLKDVEGMPRDLL